MTWGTFSGVPVIAALGTGVAPLSRPCCGFTRGVSRPLRGGDVPRAGRLPATEAGPLEVLWLYLGVVIDGPKERYHMIRQDVVYALRTMRRDKLSSLVAVLVLALGIG